MTTGSVPPSLAETSAEEERAPVVPSGRTKRSRWPLALGALVLLGIAVGTPPLIGWQRAEEQRALSLSNLRRLGIGLLLYAQDWDGRMMPPAQKQADGAWRLWPQTLRPYVTPDSTFLNPSNPFSSTTPHHPRDGYAITSGYALNRRFWDTFAPGPFPLESLELPANTALFVEAGPMWRDPLRPDSDHSPTALPDYGDTLDRTDGFSPYPSPHARRMAVVATDGHTTVVKVEHYRPEDGPHDPLYGRIGGSLYNWNGGHPNGETDGPPRD